MEPGNKYNNIPLYLQPIAMQVEELDALPKANDIAFHNQWSQYVEESSRGIQRLQVSPASEVVFLGKLSPGCQLCMEGEWDCLFMTMKCNLQCSFCCSPLYGLGLTESALGKNLPDIIEAYKRVGIKGVSFTGGEALLCFDKTLSWLQEIRNEYPKNYYWLYTNGLLLRKSHVDQLVLAGLNELRFNMAAAGYQNTTLLKMVKYAASKGIECTVEIPAIWDDREILLSSLNKWVDAGIKFLNLHELMRIDGSNSANLDGTFSILINPDGHKTAIEIRSRRLFFDIINKVEQEGIPLHVNACSIVNKNRQVRGRRKNIAHLSKKEHEKMSGQGLLQSVYFYKKDRHEGFLHPDEYEKRKAEFKLYRKFQLTRLAGLSVYEKDKYISLVELD